MRTDRTHLAERANPTSTDIHTQPGERRVARNRALLEWYRRQKRPYPWRDIGDPYLVLVSEVMLQQTQADRVVPFYERFVASFPTVANLAAASLADVMPLWTGLGYNSRARRLRDAARMITTDGWPDDLTRLPGVGPYTAAAIRCFAFGDRVPTIDTNLRRVLSRWEGRVLDSHDAVAVAATAIGDPASDWNQALMDLGSSVCRPRNPKCAVCPVAMWCRGPDVYVAAQKQAPFAGSIRQARGAVLGALIDGPKTHVQLLAGTGLDLERLAAALDGLAADGLVTGPPFALAD